MRILILMLIFSGQIFATEFTKKLETQVLVLKDKKLAKAKVDFSKKEIFVVYYSHSGCGPCVPYTKMLNEWYKKNNKSTYQLIFATRGDNTRDTLTKYIVKSKITYPIMDEKFHVNADIKNTESHVFYADADMGVPRLRFFDKEGNELYINKYVKSVYDPKEVFPRLSEILKALQRK